MEKLDLCLKPLILMTKPLSFLRYGNTWSTLHGGKGGSLKTLSWDKADGISKIEIVGKGTFGAIIKI